MSTEYRRADGSEAVVMRTWWGGEKLWKQVDVVDQTLCAGDLVVSEYGEVVTVASVARTHGTKA